MIQHQVHDDPDILFFCFCDQLLHIIQGAEHGVDILIIRNIIPVVILRRPVDRREPDRIDSQIRQIVQTADNPPDITDAVTV